MKPVGVGIIGYGTVGSATASILASNAEEIRSRNGIDLRVVAVCRRSLISADTLPSGARAVSDWQQVVEADDVDIVVETMGGTDVANTAVRSSLERGKPVVTANKNLLARFGDELFAIAAAKNLAIGFEATVAGGVPVLRSISIGAAGDRLLSVYGILNGTCNYILTQMESLGLGFDEALSQAQKAGYAEADPAADVDGIDARDKLCILARLAFGGRLAPSQIKIDGIRRVSAIDIHYAQRLDSTIRLVASAEKNGHGIELSVRPWLVKKTSMLAKVVGVNNAVFLAGENIGTQMFFGPGAGGAATGTAVVSDLVEIGRHLHRGPTQPKRVAGFHDGHNLQVCETPHPVGWFLRLTVSDQPGIIARVASSIATQSINIHSVVQEPGMAKDRLSFVITVEDVSEPVMTRAVEEINRFDFMLEPVLLLRVE